MITETTFLSESEIKKAEEEARAACVVVLSSVGDGSVLAITKKDDYANIGLPGGKLEPNEHPRDAAVRECYEETGLMVDKESLIPVYCGPGRTTVSITYLAQTIIGGKLLPANKEGLPMWVNPHMFLKDACAYKHYNIIILKKLVKAGLL